MATLDQKTLDLLKQVPSATVSGILYKKYGMRSRAISNVRPLKDDNCRFAGPAFTLRYVPQREDLNAATDLGNPNSVMLKATEEIAPRDVFVMDMQGNSAVGGIGDVLTACLIERGIAGVVADGGMRDVKELRMMGLPIFCAGPAAPPSPVSLMAIDIQLPISCGGTVVFPGDFIVADEDGVVVIPSHLVTEVVEQALEKERLDAWVRRKVEEGGGIRGRYPPDEAHLAMYRAWVAAQSK
jgi:regulator of RNase E activity RraA